MYLNLMVFCKLFQLKIDIFIIYKNYKLEMVLRPNLFMDFYNRKNRNVYKANGMEFTEFGYVAM